MNLISFLIVGLIAGWLAATMFGLSAHGFIGSLITATIGAVVLLFLINIVKKA
ncbi:MAG: GlsB/YeaQ/YmgE family stress response membrane protein [Deltaproteobacteria bacterium]|nr:GlsB/YeaQ/YmgE family stress response membrane protein [Deltaproteobacteria bacterium]